MSKRTVTVIPHQTSWRQDFLNERNKIINVLNVDNIYAIHHIGSTAVEGLVAKPIIDILVEVNCLRLLDDESKMLSTLGYKVKGENGISGRRYFTKGGYDRTHHLHIFYKGNSHAKKHILFKDYLTNFPEVKEQYGMLKQSAVKACNNNTHTYMKLKNDFIQKHLVKAQAWRDNH